MPKAQVLFRLQRLALPRWREACSIMPPCPLFFPLQLIRFASNSNPRLFNFTHKFLSAHASLPNNTEFPAPSSGFTPSPSSPINPNPNGSLQDSDFDTLRTLLKNPDLKPCRDLESALNETGVVPTSNLFRLMLKQLESSPKQAFLLVKWAEKRPGYDLPAPIFNSMLGILARAGEFEWVLMELMGKIKRGDGSNLVSAESFGILIRHYSRSGKILPAIYTFEFANSLGMDLFEVLLNALCKYGHVSVASDYIDRKTHLDSDWVPSVDVYNILFDGWFRLQNLNMVERLWLQIREQNLLPDVNTYGIVVKGYCRMGFVDKAVELLGEMRRGGRRPDRAVYDPIVDSLARAGRLKEALRMMERYLVLERGPTLSAYNSLVKGFCEAGDLVGAGKILKMMTSRGIVPTSLTYNYFFRYFKKHGKVEDGVNLYRKMMKSGYSLDQHASHLILKMLCEKEELELALEINKEMRCSEQVLDPAISTMLIDMLCKNHRLKEAVAEVENLMQSGFVPKYVTYQTLHNELKRKGLRELALKLSGVMATVPRSTTSPIAVEGLVDMSWQRKKAVMRRARVMSNILKTCSDPRELAKRKGSCKSTFYGKKPVEKGHQVDSG